jgi:hypothetical protein
VGREGDDGIEGARKQKDEGGKAQGKTHVETWRALFESVLAFRQNFSPFQEGIAFQTNSDYIRTIFSPA